MLAGLIYSIISAIAFGMLVIFAKMGYAVGMTAVEMLQCRFTFGAALLFLWLFATNRRALVADAKMLVRCALIGLLIYPIQSYCFLTAAKYIPAATDALILYFYPVTVTILSAIFFKMKIDRTVILSLLLVFTGCALVFYDAFLQKMDPFGLMLAFGAMATFSTYLMVVQVLLRDTEPLKATLYVLLFAGLAYNIAGDMDFYLNMTRQTLAIGLSLGLICSVIAVGFLYLAVEKVGSAYASIFSSVEPVATLMAAHWLLDEHVVPLQVGGAVLVVVGIVLPNLKMLRLERKFEG
ncbi:DMT family transporter [Salidesulfovibrio brasiliensis]|uniref:DMT family transporter n=1 Tax=Salidesulfovibrio brasiliensis TaxID=221711 RepID=UPI0006D00FD3|nr:DMT family transporter [Salidesulfovibrio brasiliensis]